MVQWGEKKVGWRGLGRKEGGENKKAVTDSSAWSRRQRALQTVATMYSG